MSEKDVLLKFAETIIAPRDRVFDEISEDGVSSPFRFALSSARSGKLDPDDVVDIIKYSIDKYIIELMYQIQDLKIDKGCSLALVEDGATHVVDSISDGLAGEFMTDEGWFRTLSSHAPNKFDL